MSRVQVKIDQDQCIGCGLCTRICVAHNIKLVDHKAKTILHNCVACGQCSAICPQMAIRMDGYEDQIFEKNEGCVLDPEQVLNVIRFRRSIRKFKDQPIPDDVVAQILEAGRLTHTAKNAQDVSFTILKTEKDRVEQMAVRLFKKVKPFANLISPVARQNQIDEHFFFFQAPMVIVIMAKNKTNGLLAVQNMEFVAEANGLGVLYSGYFTMAANLSYKIRKALRVPKRKRVAMTLVLGYSDVKFLRSTPHKELDVNYM